jgi:hypothetical protein
MAVLLVARATLLFIYRRRRLLSHPSVSAIGRKVKVAAAARKVGAAAGYATHGAFRGVAIACGALSIVAGAAFFWTRRGAAFVKYMSSPATPAAPLHKRHRYVQIYVAMPRCDPEM